MKYQAVLLVLSLFVCLIRSEHLTLGDVGNKKVLLHHTLAQYNAIPFLVREKEVFFNSPDQKTITGIMLYDNLHSQASVTVTAGGIGQSFVNLRLKSERGKGLDYDVGIYA